MSRSGKRPFPLVPRRRFVGVRLGGHRSPRRGTGDEVAGTRPYRPGDRPTWIDWRASARLSAARGGDEFVVREFFADSAPRVAVVVDRRPRMGLYPGSSPWLDKPAAIATAVRAIARATEAERGDLGYVESQTELPLWRAPGAPRSLLAWLDERAEADAFRAGPASLQRSLETLVRHSSVLPAGTFVFVLSDFVGAPEAGVWTRLRARGWDVTPVIVQDPTWEQSFPDVAGVLLPVRDPATGEVGEAWIGRREARARAAANETRLRGLVGGFGRLGLDPVLLDSGDPVRVEASFGRWADRRRRLRRRSA